MIRITSFACFALSLLQLRSITALTTSDITLCPKLTPRTTSPSSVRDLRADDIKVVFAIGDSITAGFGAKGIANGTLLNISNLNENRGVSYAAGGDPGATTLPNMFGYYIPNQGSSKGDHFAEFCFDILCPPFQYHPDQDDLNAGQTGAFASNLDHELDYLIPAIKSHPGIDFLNDWKFMNLQIGTNDLCRCCIDPFGLLTPDAYEGHVRDALERIRNEVPRVVVNLVGTFDESDAYSVALDKQYCPLLHGSPLRSLECECALLDGVIGNNYRAFLSNMSAEYNVRLLNIRNDYAANQNDTFGIVYQPAEIVFTSIPTKGFSSVDCFHPSLLSHAWITKVLWSGLFTPLSDKVSDEVSDKGKPLLFDPSFPVYCPSETDRIRLD